MDPEEDGLIALMRENGIPITRSNYIEMMYAEGDRPDPWTPELEGELPTFLQLREDGSDPTAEPSSEGASRRPEMDNRPRPGLGPGLGRRAHARRADDASTPPRLKGGPDHGSTYRRRRRHLPRAAVHPGRAGRLLEGAVARRAQLQSAGRSCCSPPQPAPPAEPPSRPPEPDADRPARASPRSRARSGQPG